MIFFGIFAFEEKLVVFIAVGVAANLTALAALPGLLCLPAARRHCR